MIQGESYSIGVLFPEFDINRIIRFKIAIGKTVVGTYPDGNAIQITDGFRVALTGDETKLLQGGNSNIQVYITDSQLGVLKPFVTTLKVENTNIQDAGSEANSGYNFILTVKIKETTVSYSYQFKDLIKGEQGIQGIQGVQGDKGDAGTIEVGTVTTGDAGTDVIVENVGTQSEAILNFTIPRGSAGDFFSGDYNLIINKQDAKWVDGWLHIDTGAKTRDKIIQVGYLSINTGIGTEQLKPIVHYPAGLTYQFSSIPNGFYLKDVDGRLSENTDFEFLDVRYNILSDTTYKYDGLTQLPKAGFILDEVNGEEYHSKYGIYAFNAVYPEYTGVQVQSVLDALTNFSGVDSFYTPTYARLKGCNLISRPYQNAAINENLGSNPDILTIAAHYGNTFERRDITANATTFIQNVIAVGSCGDGEPDPLTWTSYGYGMEFSERGNNLGLNADYPDVTFDHVIGYGTGIGNTFTDSVGTKNYSNILELSVGTIIKIGLTLETAIEYTIASLGSTTFTTVETINLQEGTNYVWITAHIGTAWQAVADNQKYYQSPVTSIIAAKFRKIQDATQASWDICRMAARATASNANSWDMYRGFGVIDVDAAIQYIKDNYTENADYLTALSDDVERTRGIDPMLPYEKQTDDTPIAKRDFEPVRDKLAGIEDNANKYVHPATHPPAIIEQDANNRFVTDMEKSAWDGKQNALGFTPENDANKQNSLAVDGTGEKYPTVDTLNANFRSYTPTIPYVNRVLADSGAISDIEKLTKLYVENLKLLPNTVYMWDGSAGIKTRTSGVNQYATKLYDMSAGNRDAMQATEANQPHTSGYIAPNEHRKLKGLTGETGTKGVTGSDIQIASSGAFTILIAVKWNYPRTSSRIYLSATNYIELTASAIALRGDSGNVLTCAHTFRTGLTEILIFEYSNGAGLIRVNGAEKSTTATSGAVTFGSLFLNQTSYNFDGEISKLQIANIRLSASQIQNLYNFTRLQHPEIEGINIGNQYWATSNYEGVVTGNGTVIPEVQDNAAWTALTTPAWCYYDNDPLNGAVYGKLYNWYAVQAIAANPPAGWRVATDADYAQLANYLGGTSVAGGKMKKEGLTYWNSPNTGATNESGLSVIGSGVRSGINGSFSELKISAYLGTTSNVRYRLGYDISEIVSGTFSNQVGRSIRLIRNEPVGATERNIETGYITNALGATNLDIAIPFGYQVESIRIDSETNITGLSAKLYTGALTELETLFTAKSVTANVQKVIAADADQSIQQTDAVVRINGTKADTTKRFRVWVKLTKVVFS